MSRERTHIVGPEYSTEVFTYDDPLRDPIERAPIISMMETHTMNDVVTKGFSGKIAKGLIVNNPMTMTVTKETSPRSTLEAYDNLHAPDGSGRTTEGSVFRRFLNDGRGNAYGAWDPIETETGVDSAKLHCLANIDPTPYSFAEDVAELGSTIRWVRGRSHKLVKTARQFKKGVTVLKRKAKALKHLSQAGQAKWLAAEVSNLWLEYRFIIMPLARSMTDAYEAFHDNSTVQRPTRLTSRGKYENNEEDGGTESGVPHGANDYTTKWEVKQSVDIRAGVMYSISNPTSGFRFKYGLRNKDIPVTLWNVVRLSFMVDRFINISAALKGLTNLMDPNIKIHAGWVASRVNLEKRTKYTSMIDTTGHWNYTLSGEYQTNDIFTYSRNPWIPTLSDTIPPVEMAGLVKDVTSTMDLLALGISFLRSGLK